jgi:hypothetical protein
MYSQGSHQAVTDDFGGCNFVVTDDSGVSNMVVTYDSVGSNMVITYDFGGSNMVVTSGFCGSNMVITYIIMMTQWSSLGHKLSLSLSESSQCCQFQSRKSPEFFKLSLCQNFITKMSNFLQVACLAA